METKEHYLPLLPIPYDARTRRLSEHLPRLLDDKKGWMHQTPLDGLHHVKSL